MQIYTVKQGDTIDRIAGAAGMDPLRLAHDNQIEPPYRLAVGQSLLVAGGDSEEAGVRLGGFRIGNVQTGPVLMNGYAYPWIDEQILSETCMYLTSIAISLTVLRRQENWSPLRATAKKTYCAKPGVRPLSRFWSLHRWEQTAGLITIWWRFLYGIWKFSKS